MGRIGYGRISTGSGEQQRALEVQLAWLETQSCDQILQDIDSGFKNSAARPAYQELRQLIASGTVQEIRATAMSRLGRDAEECDRLIALCDHHGVKVLTRDDGVLTLNTAEDLLMTRLKASLAQGESMRLSKRVHGGLEMGRQLGKPMRKPCWGYRLSKDRLTLEPVPEEFSCARRFIDYLIENSWRLRPSMRTFPEHQPFKSPKGLRSWLHNPTIRGAIGYGQLPNNQFREVLWDRHPAIITHDEYASYQRHAAVNHRNWGANATKKLRALCGLCFCSECGHRLNYKSGRRIPSLRCSNDFCTQKYRSTREELIIRWVTQQLSERAAEQLAAAAESHEPPEAIQLRQQINQLQALGDPDLQPVIQAKTARLDAVLASPQADQAIVQEISDPDWWNCLTYERLTEILHATVVEITIDRQQPVKAILKF